MHNARLLREQAGCMMEWQEEDETEEMLEWQHENNEDEEMHFAEAQTAEQEQAAIEESIVQDETETQRFLAIAAIAHAAFTRSDDYASLPSSRNTRVASSSSVTLEDQRARETQEAHLAWQIKYCPALTELYDHAQFVPPPLSHKYSDYAAGLILVNLEHILSVMTTSPLLKHSASERQTRVAEAVERLVEGIAFGVKCDVKAALQKAEEERKDAEMLDAFTLGSSSSSSSSNSVFSAIAV